MKNIVKQSGLGRFANFITVLALLGVIYSIFATFSFFVLILYILIVVLVFLLTLSSVNYLDSIDQSQDIFKTIFQTVPTVLIVVMSLCVLAFIIIILKKEYKNFVKAKSSLILNIVIIVLSLIFLAVHIFKVIAF
jgi:cobalamin synthase